MGSNPSVFSRSWHLAPLLRSPVRISYEDLLVGAPDHRFPCVYRDPGSWNGIPGTPGPLLGSPVRIPDEDFLLGTPDHWFPRVYRDPGSWNRIPGTPGPLLGSPVRIPDEDFLLGTPDQRFPRVFSCSWLLTATPGPRECQRRQTTNP